MTNAGVCLACRSLTYATRGGVVSGARWNRRAVPVTAEALYADGTLLKHSHGRRPEWLAHSCNGIGTTNPSGPGGALPVRLLIEDKLGDDQVRRTDYARMRCCANFRIPPESRQLMQNVLIRESHERRDRKRTARVAGAGSATDGSSQVRITPSDDAEGPLAGERLAHGRVAKNRSPLLEIAKELHLDEPKVRALEEKRVSKMLGAAGLRQRGTCASMPSLVGVSQSKMCMADYYKHSTRSARACRPLSGRRCARQSRESVRRGPWIAIGRRR